MLKINVFIVLFFTAFTAQAQSIFCVDSIIFEGDFKTKSNIIERELNFNTNDCWSIDSTNSKLNVAKNRLLNTQLFNAVKADTVTLNFKNCVVFYLDERFPIFPQPNIEFADRNINVWWKEQNMALNRINIGLELQHKNVRGARDILGVGAQVGYTNKILLNYTIPYLDKRKKHGIGAGFAFLNNKELAYNSKFNKLEFKRFENNYALNQFEANVWYKFRPKFATNHTFNLGYKHLQIHDSIAQFLNPNYLGDSNKVSDIFALSYRIEFNGVDNWNYPLIGYRWIGIASLDYILNNNLIPSLHWQADWYKKIAPKTYSSLILRGKNTFGKNLPYIYQKNMGYDFDEMRGYQYYVNDGSFFSLLRANIKYEILKHQFNLPIKYFRHIPLSIYIKGLADVGYAYSKAINTNTLNNQWLYSYGFGIDIVTLYDIRFRFEYVFNKFGDHDLYIHKSGE